MHHAAGRSLGRPRSPVLCTLKTPGKLSHQGAISGAMLCQQHQLCGRCQSWTGVEPLGGPFWRAYAPIWSPALQPKQVLHSSPFPSAGLLVPRAAELLEGTLWLCYVAEGLAAHPSVRLSIKHTCRKGSRACNKEKWRHLDTACLCRGSGGQGEAHQEETRPGQEEERQEGAQGTPRECQSGQ